jgi:large subunit ribosomal protein L21
MFAIVDILGQQFQVTKDATIFVHRLPNKEGENVEFKNVLIYNSGNDVKVGTPNINGCSVKAQILKHVRDEKVIVFKKKRRKGYQKRNGHRQDLSQIKIQEIILK